MTVCDIMDCSLPVHGISQARILEWIAISSSRGSFWPRDPTRSLWIAGSVLHCCGFFTAEPPGKPAYFWSGPISWRASQRCEPPACFIEPLLAYNQKGSWEKELKLVARSWEWPPAFRQQEDRICILSSQRSEFCQHTGRICEQISPRKPQRQKPGQHLTSISIVLF